MCACVCVCVFLVVCVQNYCVHNYIYIYIYTIIDTIVLLLEITCVYAPSSDRNSEESS